MLKDKRWRREQIIEKVKRTRRENERAARFQRMGGQGKPPPLRWRSLFDSDVKKADDGMIVVESGAGCDAPGPPRKKKLLSRKRRFRLDSRHKPTASEFD